MRLLIPISIMPSIFENSFSTLQKHAWLTAQKWRLLLANRKKILKKLGVVGLKLGQVLLPASCLICKQPASHGLCAPCDAQYFGMRQYRCAYCALPLTASNLLCGACITHRPSFERTLILANYAPTLDVLALGLKFHARLAVASDWASRLAEVARSTWLTTDWPNLIVPVPLSAQRLSQRGYNQAWEIARPLAGALDLPTQYDLLKRIRDTPPQLQLSARERRSNLSKAFELARPIASLAGQHIAVVDDVMTSGTTLEVIARLLKNAGAKQVTNLVALRTVRAP